jgi:hypothetical protein
VAAFFVLPTAQNLSQTQGSVALRLANAIAVAFVLPSGGYGELQRCRLKSRERESE